MAQLGSVQSSNTFLQWLSHANKAYTRLDQFAINESALYANTISANTGLNVKGQDSDSRYANTVNLALKQDTATERAALANTNAYIATRASQADHLSALANTNAYIATMLPLAGGTMSGQLHARAGVSGGTGYNIELGDNGVGDGGIISDANMTLVIDADNNQNNATFRIAKNNTDIGSAVEIFKVLEEGDVVITGNTHIQDAKRLHVGTGLDAEFYHDGNNTALNHTGTGDFYIQSDQFYFRSASTSENYVTATVNGSVKLYDNGAEKISTSAGGGVILGTLTANGVSIDHGNIAITGSGNREISVNSATGGASIELGGATGAHIDFKQPFSDDLDMRIGSGATGGYISTAGGVLNIQANTTYNRLQTYSANTTHNDNVRAFFGTSNDLSIHHDSNHSYISDLGTGGLYIQGDTFVSIGDPSGETGLTYTKDGAVQLYHDNVEKMATTATGIDVSGRAAEDQLTNATATGVLNIDFSIYKNFHLTLTGNITLDNTITTTNAIGQSGLIVFKQDGSGGRTLSLGSYWNTPSNQSITLSTGANDVDIIPYYVESATSIHLGQLTRDIN